MNTTANPNLLSRRLADILSNPHLLQFYSKSNCRDCKGRGFRVHSIRNEFNQWVESKTICPCVKKAVSKEIKELEQTDG
jgi:hypothetical protein